MTRVNLVEPSSLMDQHLFAEFREIKMIAKALRRSLSASSKRGETQQQFLQLIPKNFTLNTGHVSFFYDKGLYLQERYTSLQAELRKRNMNFDEKALLDDAGVFHSVGEMFNRHYEPTAEALSLIRQRIAEKIAMKPNWYRHYGKVCYSGGSSTT